MRYPILLGIGLLVLTPAFAGFTPVVTHPERASEPSAAPLRSAAPSSERSEVEKQKHELGSLIKELQRSPRSFMYLRTVGYKESDEEFDHLIAANGDLFHSTRIVRRDEQGIRQIPGWPGITLAAPYRAR